MAELWKVDKIVICYYIILIFQLQINIPNICNSEYSPNNDFLEGVEQKYS